MAVLMCFKHHFLLLALLMCPKPLQIPPHSSKETLERNPGDNEEEHWGRFTNPATQAKISPIREMNKAHREARAAQQISSSAHLGGAKPKQINLTGSWTGQKVQEKNTAPKDNKINGALEKTTLFPLGVKPFIPIRDKDEEETQLLALGQFCTQGLKTDFSTIQNSLCLQFYVQFKV